MGIGSNFSYTVGYWQDLEDLKDELEKELAEIEQYHIPVKRIPKKKKANRRSNQLRIFPYLPKQSLNSPVMPS